jgi:hypothetical protein
MEQVPLWEPPAGEPPARQLPVQPPRPPWYRRSWFVALVVVAVSATAGALAGSHLP